MAHYYDTGAGLAFNEHGLDVLPPGWTEITEVAYNAALGIIEANNDASVAAVKLAECLARKAAYDDLVATNHPFAHQFAAVGTTDASGNVTFNLTPAAFAANPVVQGQLQTAVADAVEVRVTALSPTSVTFNVRRAPAVTILGISVVSVPIAFSGATVHCLAVGAGSSAGALGLLDSTAHQITGYEHGSC